MNAGLGPSFINVILNYEARTHEVFSQYIEINKLFFK